MYNEGLYGQLLYNGTAGLPVVTVLADTQQTIWVQREVQASTEQRIYRVRETLADTRQRIYMIRETQAGTQQIIYLPRIIQAGTRQLIYLVREVLAYTQQIITILIASNRQIHTKLMIGRPDGLTWVDVTDYLEYAEVELGDVSSVGTGSGVDGRVRTLRFTLHNDGQNRFSPRDRNSTWNQFNSQYTPLLWPNREVILDVAVTAPNETPTQWVRLFHGLLGDNIQTSGPSVSCECRDLAKRLQDCYIETVRQYGSDAGTPAETVIQQILDDNLGAGVVTLFCPASPGFMITPYQVEYQSVWDAIQQVANQIGWYLGYRWDTVTSQFRLTLMEPPRQKTTADFILGYMNDFSSEDLDINDSDVRNVVLVTYRNKVSGLRASVTVSDATSIAEYGRRAMQIEEADASLIDTQAEALALANAALSDLKDLHATTRLDMPFLPEMDVFATIAVYDPRISSTTDFYAVESVRHTLDFSGGSFRTEIVASGHVVGAHTTWLEMQTRPGASPVIRPEELSPVPIMPKEVVLPQQDGTQIVMTEWGLMVSNPNMPGQERIYVNRLAMGEASDGDYVALNWQYPPKVLLSERRLRCYNKDYASSHQRLEVFADNISPQGFTIHCQAWVEGTAPQTYDVNPDYTLYTPGSTWTSGSSRSSTTLLRVHGYNLHYVWTQARTYGSTTVYYKIYYKLISAPDWTLVGEFSTTWGFYNGGLWYNASSSYVDWEHSFYVPAGTYQVKVEFSREVLNHSDSWNYVYISWWQDSIEVLSARGDVAWIAIEGGTQ